MNEHLKNKRKTSLYWITVESGDDTVKGYVNWPLGVVNRKYGFHVDHLPTGFTAKTLHHAETFTQAKKYINLLVETIGADRLVNLVDDVEAQKIYTDIVCSKLPEEPKPELKTVTLSSNVTLGHLKKLVPYGLVEVKLGEATFLVDGRAIRKFLTIQDKDTQAEATIEDRYLETRAYNYWGLCVLKSGTFKTLVFKYNTYPGSYVQSEVSFVEKTA